jgi:hypothetical protein
VTERAASRQWADLDITSVAAVRDSPIRWYLSERSNSPRCVNGPLSPTARWLTGSSRHWPGSISVRPVTVPRLELAANVYVDTWPSEVRCERQRLIGTFSAFALVKQGFNDRPKRFGSRGTQRIHNRDQASDDHICDVI